MSRIRIVTLACVTASLAGTALAVGAGADARGDAAGQPATGPYQAGRVLVHYRDDVDANARAALEHGNGATHSSRLTHLGTDVLTVPVGREHSVVRQLVASGEVEYAEVNGLAQADDITPTDPFWSKEWGPLLVHAPHAWGQTTGSSTVTVAVVDSGLAPGLPEFTGRTLSGYNAFTGTADPRDDNGHGTYAAGVALAQGNNGVGVAGMCWRCQILPVKVLDSSGQGDYATIARGITWAADHGARVINLSLGGTTPSATLDSAVSYAVNKGIVVVVAAGNSGSSTQTYPAASPGALSVGASDPRDILYGYSNRGSWVDVAAPGSNYTTGGDGNYYSFGGTSSAAPVVSGLAALALSARPSATVAGVTQLIESTTAPVSGGGVVYGRVDAGAAMDALIGSTDPAPAPSSSPTSSPTPAPAPSSSPTTSPTTSPTPAPTATTAPKRGGGPKH